MANTLNAGLQARGETRVFRNLLIAISILNVIIDPALMFGVTIGETTVIPRLEEAGTALATVGLYGIGIIYLLGRARKLGVFDGVQRSYFYPDRARLAELVQQSLPASLNFMIMTLGSFVINFFISRYGRDPIAAYGAALRIEQIALLPLLGINVALATLTGQNNGAARLDRVREALTASLKAALFVTVLILPPVLLTAPWLLGVFTELWTFTRSCRHWHANTCTSRAFTLLDVFWGLQYARRVLLQAEALYDRPDQFVQLDRPGITPAKRPAMIMWVGLYRQIAAPFVVFPLLAITLALEETGVFWGCNWRPLSAWSQRRFFRSGTRGGC